MANEIKSLGRTAWRNYATVDLPSSGVHEPSKTDIIAFVDRVNTENEARKTTLAAHALQIAAALSDDPDSEVLAAQLTALADRIEELELTSPKFVGYWGLDGSEIELRSPYANLGTYGNFRIIEFIADHDLPASATLFIDDGDPFPVYTSGLEVAPAGLWHAGELVRMIWRSAEEVWRVLSPQAEASANGAASLALRRANEALDTAGAALALAES